jgi:hypothetical protein
MCLDVSNFPSGASRGDAPPGTSEHEGGRRIAGIQLKDRVIVPDKIRRQLETVHDLLVSGEADRFFMARCRSSGFKVTN